MEVVILLLIYLGRLCAPNKTEDVNLNVFNMITRINESKTLANHIL